MVASPPELESHSVCSILTSVVIKLSNHRCKLVNAVMEPILSLKR